MSGRLPIIILGSGGHAMVVWDLLESIGRFDVLGFTDISQLVGTQRQLGSLARPVLGDDTVCAEYLRRYPSLQLLAGIGPEPCAVRRQILGTLESCGAEHVCTAIHPRATVAASVRLSHGTVVMAGAVINPRAVIGAHCVVNTSATVDHDCCLGDNVFIQPGAHVGGTVTIADGAVVGIGASVREQTHIGRDAVIGGGAFVNRDVPDHAVVVGVPARVLRYRTQERLLEPTAKRI